MTISRKQQVSLENTAHYHCMARCVRRAFLCGTDSVTGQNFDHRKQWIVDRFHELASIFAIKICAYAVMSNHYHLVLHVDCEEALSWSEDEVKSRWCKIFKKGTKPSRKGLNEKETPVLSDVEIWRDRLSDISWFMRCLNESIARRANKEDQCKGRFWEGRFKSQALVDEGALLACMVYVDLNPVRAGMSSTPTGSEFTSIQERKVEQATPGKSELLKFKNVNKNANPKEHPCLPIKFGEYLSLIEWTGNAIIQKKQGTMPQNLQPVMIDLRLRQKGWFDSSTQFEKHFFYVAGSGDKLKQLSAKQGTKWIRGKCAAEKMYLKSA
ncbi:MAG: transposase [Proteobacteria bacterium]|nr:transposase [Pseudomonadota bacterium]